ncbi:MAG TPA: DoxX family protein [Gemmatimonadales bacterium]|nr:DoxX family protein [Gemmatimonadales bacterium]
MTISGYAIAAAAGGCLAVGVRAGARELAWRFGTTLLAAVAGTGALAMLGVVGFLTLGRAPSRVAGLLFTTGQAAVALVAGAVLFDGMYRLVTTRRRTDAGLRLATRTPLVWGSRLLMATYYAFTATYSWTRPVEAYRFYQASDLSHAFFVFIAIWESAGALGLIFSPTARIAALGLFVEMVGAVGTHLHNAFAYGMPLGDTLDALKMLPVLAFIAIGVGGKAAEGAAPEGREPYASR